MKIFNFGNDYVNERKIREQEKELRNVGDSNAANSQEVGAEGDENTKEATSEGTAKLGRKKKEAKEERAEPSAQV